MIPKEATSGLRARQRAHTFMQALSLGMLAVAAWRLDLDWGWLLAAFGGGYLLCDGIASSVFERVEQREEAAEIVRVWSAPPTIDHTMGEG